MSRTTNGIGWVVQVLTCPHGWRTVKGPYAAKKDAHDAMTAIGDDDGELRVYEAMSQ